MQTSKTKTLKGYCLVMKPENGFPEILAQDSGAVQLGNVYRKKKLVDDEIERLKEFDGFEDRLVGVGEVTIKVGPKPKVAKTPPMTMNQRMEYITLVAKGRKRK